MKCEEPLSVAQLKSLIDEGDWTDAALSIILDGATDLIFNLLGHSFGRAIRIFHDESEEATAATVTVTATQITLIITGGANAGTYEYTFADYTDISSMVDAIEQEDVGFVTSLVEGISLNEASENLHTLAATEILGLSNRQVLCIQYTTETLDGTGEGYIFTSLPIRSVVSIVQDGTTVTSDYYWEKTNGYVIYRYATGSQYCKYLVDLWSLRTPCNVVIRYTPLWLRIPGVMKLVLRALCQHTIVDSSMLSETIGDYSYRLGDVWASIAPFWPMLAGYSIMFMP